jgi:hypothetical protein
MGFDAPPAHNLQPGSASNTFGKTRNDSGKFNQIMDPVTTPWLHEDIKFVYRFYGAKWDEL